MGCAFGKQKVSKEDLKSPKEKNNKVAPPAAVVVSTAAAAASALEKKKQQQQLEPVVVVLEKEKGRVVKVRSKHNSNNGTSHAVLEEARERRRERREQGEARHNRSSNVPRNNLEGGEQVAAGWPAWLSAVAGDAIKGWIPRHAASFEKLDKIGQGTYSNVYKARDLETGRIVALKKVRFDNLEPESVRFMAREIQVLRRLDHPNVVKLEGLVTSRMSCSLYLVFEYMEHDLAGLAACPGIVFTEAQVKCYLQQLLDGLDHCHQHGVLHRDIKGSNLLLNNDGILKIADFGLATFFNPNQKQPLTSRVVTLWYRPPELLLGATEYGVAVDLWSTGCILAELLAGKPIMPGRTEVEQLHKIFKLCGSPSEEYWKKSKLPHATIFKPQQPYKRSIRDHFKEFPTSSLALLDTLLAIEPADRGSASEALNSDFFKTEPLACDPSSLPHYPPSKEFDAKIRDDEARRQRAGGGRMRGSDASKRPGARDRTSRAVGAPDANAELAVSLEKRRMNPQAAMKSKSEKFPPLHEHGAVQFSMHRPQPKQPLTEVKGTSPVPETRVPSISFQSGPQPALGASLAGNLWGKKHKEQDVRMAPPRAVSRTTNLMTVTDFSPVAYPQHAADMSSIPPLVVAKNGAGDNHYREQGGGGPKNMGVQYDDGKVNRRSERRDLHSKKEMPSNQEPTRTHGQASSMISDDAHNGADSHQKDANHLSKPMIMRNFLRNMNVKFSRQHSGPKKM